MAVDSNAEPKGDKKGNSAWGSMKKSQTGPNAN